MSKPPAGPKLVNPFELEGRWFKANLHTHSTLSDGQATSAERVAQYAAMGYSVLALTDHWRTQDVAGFGGRNLLVLSGIEIHPLCPAPPGRWHFVGLGVPREMAFADPPGKANACIARLRAAGAVVVLAHPAWCGQSFADFEGLRGLDAIEVYNSTCDRAGRPTSESEWAMALDHGWRIPALAVDDCHRPSTDDVGEGWTWLRMKSLTVENVLAAVRRGACYASRGPKIHDFRLVGGQLKLRCSPVAKIHFVSTPGRGARRRAEPGRTISSFSFEAAQQSGWPWPYVRAVVTDTAGRQAWTNPLFPGER